MKKPTDSPDVIHLKEVPKTPKVEMNKPLKKSARGPI